MIVEAFNKALKYVHNNPAKAELMFDRLLKKTQFKEIYVNLGVACRNQEKFEKAERCLAKALDPKVPFSDGELSESYNIACTNLGLLKYAFEKDDEAEALYLKALALTPDHADTMWNLSLTRLRKFSTGKSVDIEEAWKMYDYRFKRTNPYSLRIDRPLLMWDYKSKVDSIVVLAEQGMGDMLMFSRYLEELKKYASKIYVQCSSEFAGLYENTCIDVSKTTAQFGVPSGNLGRICNFIPDGKWLADRYIPKVGGEFSIACCWSGNSSHSNDSYRSTNSNRFLELSKFGKLYTIGPGAATKGFTHLKTSSWMETIKELEKVDLVISVDTSIVHLCGSLGKPCWVLMPRIETDFRWGDSSLGYDNLWYDSVTVIRNKNNWDDVFKEVKKLLT